MRSPFDARLGYVVVLPLVTIGVLSAMLVWEIEHVGSLTLALGLAAVATLIGFVVARLVRRQIDELSTHYESLLRTADEESRRAETAARIRDEFLSTLSHELRTPLNSVLGWSRLLAGGRLDAAQTAKAIQAIERAGWAQSRLIEDLLDVSHIVSGRLRIAPRPTPLQPIVQRVVDAVSPAASAKGLALEVTLDPSIGPVLVDPDRLQQIAWHLLSNAIKFTGAGRIVVTLTRADHEVCLSVTDTGVGFDERTAALLFERFRQGDSSSTRPFGGVGLGLGIVRHLVEMHGGTVAARSGGVDRGATFEVRLPHLTTLEPVDSPAPAYAEGPLLTGIRVLVVDDDASALELARSSLEPFGAEVQTARSADEARRAVGDNPPDVLLSDVRMPGEDGLQLIRDIRRAEMLSGRHTPAAALTVLARAGDRHQAFDAGFEMHVAKPVDPVELAVLVAQLAKDE